MQKRLIIWVWAIVFFSATNSFSSYTKPTTNYLLREFIELENTKWKVISEWLSDALNLVKTMKNCHLEEEILVYLVNNPEFVVDEVWKKFGTSKVSYVFKAAYLIQVGYLLKYSSTTLDLYSILAESYILQRHFLTAKNSLYEKWLNDEAKTIQIEASQISDYAAQVAQQETDKTPVFLIFRELKYDAKIDKIFGQTLSEDEKNYRVLISTFHSIFKFYEKYSLVDPQIEKANFLKSVFDSLRFETEQ